MEEHIFKVTEIVGTSSKNIEDAIEKAIERASRSLRNLGWFEVMKTTGHVKEGRIEQYQVTLKVGFTLEG